MTNLTRASSEDWGLLLLRLAIGGLMLFHGIDKLIGGIEGITGLVQSKGLPGFVAWGVLVGEVVAPVLIVLGFYVRPAGAVLAFNMLVAILLAHPNDVLKLGEHGEWAIELQMLYLMGALCITLLGPGRITIRGMSKQPKDVDPA